MNKQLLESELLRDEGLVTKPYKDSKGILTIGVGRNLEATGITVPEAMYLLDNDIDKVMAWLTQNLPWWVVLSDARQRALANMCFNLGGKRLLEFHKFLRALQDGDYTTAGIEMLDSDWAKQVGARAQRLHSLIVNG